MTTPLEQLAFDLPRLRMTALAAGPEGGPVTLLLHGFPEFSESWREVIPHLARAGLRCVAPDLRGYGGSDVPRHGYDLDSLAEDVAQLARTLSPTRPVHLVGHDWGGAVAYHVAEKWPALVDRLVVVNCPHPAVMARRIWRPAQLRRSWYIFFFQLPWLPEWLLAQGGGARVMRLIRANLARRGAVEPGRLAPYAANFARKGVARAALAYYRQAVRGALAPGRLKHLGDEPRRIQAPFRLVWATEDRALHPLLTRDLEPWFEHPPEVVFLPGVGHFAPLEAPEQVARLVLEHLAPGVV